VPVKTQEIIELNNQHVINTYGARTIALSRGDGMLLWDADGKEYLDFFAGIAVANLGHCHPKVTAAICEQAAKLVHVSNLYYIEPQARLAAQLSALSFADRWFFCNGGAEANEGAIKLARRFWSQQGRPKPHIITMEQSFHGRTLTTLTATGQRKYQEGFEPLTPGFRHVPFNDFEALEAAITPETGAIMLEPIQGEGGVRVPASDYLARVRALCDARSVLLIFDEVQTGLGRTGKLFAYEHSGITPDIMTLAKGLGNGIPIGALGCTEEVSTGFSVGSHACTFGGNPLSAAAALATLGALVEEKLVEHAAQMGSYIVEKLSGLRDKHVCIVEIRGKGLMIGVEMDRAIGPLVETMMAAGIICGPAGPNILRFVPPLIIQREHVDRMVSILDTSLHGFCA
jgi:acetylornithine/N-succinyldiaminopimelate aminotransferase